MVHLIQNEKRYLVTLSLSDVLGTSFPLFYRGLWAQVDVTFRQIVLRKHGCSEFPPKFYDGGELWVSWVTANAIEYILIIH